MNPSTETSNELENLRNEINRGTKILNLSGLTSTSAKAYILSEIQKEICKTFVIITDLNKDLETWENDLDFFQKSVQSPKSKVQSPKAENSPLLTFPSFEADVYSGVSPHAETQEKRALTLWNLTNSKANFLILSAKSLITKIPPSEKLKNLGANLKRGEDFPPDILIGKLFASGYKKDEPLANVGEFSTRGGIIDVWSPDAENPVRIEFFGDTVDSIRTFDADSQLSIEQLDKISVAPMREFAATSDDFEMWAELASERFADEKYKRNLKDRTDFADEGESFSGWEFLMPLVNEADASVFDYLQDCIFVIDEPSIVEQNLGDFYESLQEHYEEIIEHGEIGLEPFELFLEPETLREYFDKNQRLEIRSLGKIAAETDEEFVIDGQLSESNISNFKFQNENQRPKTKDQRPLFLFPITEKSVDFEIQSRSTRKYQGDIKKFASELKKEKFHAEPQSSQREDSNKDQRPKTKDQTLFVFQSQGLAERFNDILRDYEIVLPDNLIKIGDLSSGFEIPSLNLKVYNETEIFGEKTQLEFEPHKPKTKSRKPKTSAFISDFRDLKEGDFVVHVDHGIGRFEGLQTLETGGVLREFMLLVYAENSKLFVPVERLDLVSRYGSREGQQPTLDRLGGIGWQKTKAKAKRAMRDMADELLRLYAERKLVQGFAFSADAPWQKEFEEAFPYQLTNDQATSIDELKKDMERAIPMDRLVVGDVGYGKTEVAMRACFKAVMDNKQVAVLTPTTVLSYQHFETFKQRFAVFPVKIEMISRFRSRKEQKEIIAQTEKGEIDILIGTHRILSNDVKLPKLGLVIVDEEQRFGVAHKEKLKQLKKKVDVLTLTATPIPRTLNMSMMGMRDMSIIETPPRDRLAINTQVVQFSEGVIKSAIETEISRNGQVFFIHNRVQTIEAIAAHIQKIVPNARIVIGHGQMSEKELEKVMLDFVDYKYDILVATTIIENGIDIPRANTIIINRADNYGLSQLYQLRGRVGRSSRRAYSYLLIPSELELTPIARRRLSAIREFSDLGAGFRIAALDLELRGAGNLLGGEQSGQMEALGFDLYTKMLNRTIQELRGEEIEDETSVSLNLGVDVSISHEYIGETSQRLRTYKRISSTETEDELRQIYVEIQDRYGKLPESVENLFEYARLRQTAEEMHVVSVDKAKEGIAIKLDEKSQVSPEKLMKLVEEIEGSAFSPNGILRIPVAEENLIENARRILVEIKAV
ncbi:MAG: transcription-repair coupling factor [Aridibacter sp.]